MSHGIVCVIKRIPPPKKKKKKITFNKHTYLDSHLSPSHPPRCTGLLVLVQWGFLHCSVGNFPCSVGNFSLLSGDFPLLSGEFFIDQWGFPLAQWGIFHCSVGIFPCSVGNFSLLSGEFFLLSLSLERGSHSACAGTDRLLPVRTAAACIFYFCTRHAGIAVCRRY